MRNSTRERLAPLAAEWRHAGLINDSQAEVLAARWETQGSGTALLRTLAVFAIFWMATSVLGLIGIWLGTTSPLALALFLGMLAAGLWIAGTRMVTNPTARHFLTGQVLITLSLVVLFTAWMSLFYAHDENRIPFTFVLLLTSAGAFATAYRYALRWPQFLALLLLFHGIGIHHGYLGHGSYFAEIADKRQMAVIALISIMLGVWHEHVLEEARQWRQVGFGHLYIVFGMIYLNLSLWFLTLKHDAIGWVLLFTAAAIGQLIAGARLKDARFTGFGVVFLGIDLYTRLFEYFWDRWEKGVFLLAAGLLGMAVGIAMERVARLTEAQS